MTIGTQHIDLDLSVAPDGFSKGLIEMDDEEIFAASLPSFEVERKGLMVPRAKWKEMALKRMATKSARNDVTKIYSQGNISSCTGFASTQLVEVTRRRRYGLPNWVSLSGLATYMGIQGVTRNSGASIRAAMDVICRVGPLPQDTPENRAEFEHTFPLATWQKLPPGSEKTSKRFRGMRFCVARGIDQVFSGLLGDLCGMVGRDQHAVPYIDAAWSEKIDEPVCPFANSWGPAFGDGGIGYDSLRITRDIICYFLLDVVTGPELPEV